MTHPFAETQEAPLEVIGRIEEWGEGQAREVKVHKKPMTVVRCGDQFFAVNSICPHMGGPLSCGKVEHGRIQCPWHGWVFDIATGKSPNGHHLDCYQVVVEDGLVKVGWVRRESV